MAFKSWQSYWNVANRIVHDNRYIHDAETVEFLNEVLYTCDSRKTLLKKDDILWRAQLGCDIQENGEELPYNRDRMYPLPCSAPEGRANPEGIPYLYLAAGKETAMCETRPWVGSEISVAQFKITRDIILVNCSLHHSKHPFYYIDNEMYEPDESEREKAVWTHIDKAFSTPVTANESQADSVPTQVIAGLFKHNGFDGLLYSSSLNEDNNICLFDVQSAEFTHCYLYKPRNVIYDFQETAGPSLTDQTEK